MCKKIHFGALWYELLFSEWQPSITRMYSREKNVSDKKERFSLMLVCAPSSHFAPKSASLFANTSPYAGQPTSLHPESWVTGLRVLCLLAVLTWEAGAPVNMKELYLRLLGGLVCQRVDKNRFKQFHKCWWTCDEVGSRNLEKHGRWRAILRTVIN